MIYLCYVRWQHVSVLCENSAYSLQQTHWTGIYNSPCLESSYLLYYVVWQVVKTNQFSVTRHKKVANAVAGSTGLPGMLVIQYLVGGGRFFQSLDTVSRHTNICKHKATQMLV